MSDNLGLNQTRVLDSTNRSFEQIVFQKKKPPLSCELNLGGSMVMEKARDLARLVGPSGWSMIGSLKDNIPESSCITGDIVTSASYAANSVKLMAYDKGNLTNNLVAWVNGWQVLVQGTNSADENNIITLSTPYTGAARVDFVFLEVWRKLLTVSDTVWKYGNVLYGGINNPNDLVDPTINIETTLRIQIQYRIRVVNGIDIVNYPDGFDPNYVFAQGPLSSPLTCNAIFAAMPDDPGLYRAGVGDSAAQEQMQTVDGYTYAIPLFAVARRNSTTFDPTNNTNGAGRSLANYWSGMPSDRPDNLYSDWIVSDDILDMRHKIVANENLKEVAEKGFVQLSRGLLHSKMGRSFVGADRYGPVMLQVDAINPTAISWADNMAIHPDSSRRMFLNASKTSFSSYPSILIAINQIDNFASKTINDKSLGTVGGPWTATDRVRINAPTGAQIVSVDELWSSINGIIDPSYWTASLVDPSYIEAIVDSGNPDIGTSANLILTYTIKYVSAPNGFTQLPQKMLEARKIGPYLPIALRDADIRVRTANAVVAADGTHYTTLSYRGGATGEPYNFGHQMIYQTLGNGTEIVTIPQRNAYGYDVIGIARSQIAGTDVAPTRITRDGTNYTISFASSYGLISPTTNVQLSLYTATKFFDTNKQGRGIVETYEMKNLIPNEAADGARTAFTVTNMPGAILAIGSSYVTGGFGTAYVDGTAVELLTNNKHVYDSSKFMTNIQFPGGIYPGTPRTGSEIEIPVLTRSAIGLSEGFAFFYKTIPYQGLLDSTAAPGISGSIEAEGPTIITTAGSGGITNVLISSGLVMFSKNSVVVQGNNTSWLSTVKPGYILKDSTKEYVVETVYLDNVIFLTGQADRDSVTWENYLIEGFDIPSFSQHNLIDRLPALSTTNDCTYFNNFLRTYVGDYHQVQNSTITGRVQDILGLPANSVTFGAVTPVTPSHRGKTAVHIDATDMAPLGLSNLGLKLGYLETYSDAHKAYQCYIINRENTGRLYLAVVGSETDNSSYTKFLNHASNDDSVDIFELPGRPLINKRTV